MTGARRLLTAAGDELLDGRRPLALDEPLEAIRRVALFRLGLPDVILGDVQMLEDLRMPIQALSSAI